MPKVRPNRVQDAAELLTECPFVACASVLETSWETVCKENAVKIWIEVHKTLYML